MSRANLKHAFETINAIELPAEDNKKKFEEVADTLPIVLADVDQQVREEDASIDELEKLSENSDIASDAVVEYNSIGDDIDNDAEVITTIVESGDLPATETLQLLLNNQRRLIRDYDAILSDDFKGSASKTSVIGHSLEAMESTNYTRMSKLMDLQERYALESKNVADYVIIALGHLQKVVIDIINSAINFVDLQGKTINNLKTLVAKVPAEDYNDRKTFHDYKIFKALVYSLTQAKGYDFPEFCRRALDVSKNIKTMNDFTIKYNGEIISNAKLILNLDSQYKYDIDNNSKGTGDVPFADKMKMISLKLKTSDDPLFQLLVKLFGKSATNAFCGFELDGVSLKNLIINDGVLRPLSDKTEYGVIRYQDLEGTIKISETINNNVKQGRSQLGNVQKSITTAYQTLKDVFEKGNDINNRRYRQQIRTHSGELQIILRNQKNYLIAVIESNKIITRYITKSIRVATTKE